MFDTILSIAVLLTSCTALCALFAILALRATPPAPSVAVERSAAVAPATAPAPAPANAENCDQVMSRGARSLAARRSGAAPATSASDAHDLHARRGASARPAPDP